MTLLELLVKELPKRGGWPIDSDDERTLTATLPDICWGIDRGGYYAFRGPCDSVSHKLYEETLLALKSEWDGEGLPPVGTKCEFKCATGEWVEVEITAIARNGLCFVEAGKNGENYVSFEREFRPIRSPEDVARDEAILAINSCVDASGTLGSVIYDAIAAGKIPGVKLED